MNNLYNPKKTLLMLILVVIVSVSQGQAPIDLTAATSSSKDVCDPVTDLVVNYTTDCKANLAWYPPESKMLWDNTEGMTNLSHLSTFWMDGKNQIVMADDFDVPEGEIWYISEVYYNGKAYNTPESIGIAIYEDNGNNRPTTIPIYEKQSFLPVGGISNGDMTINLTTPIKISKAGKYWISIYGVFHDAVNPYIEYFVTTSTVPKGATMCRWDPLNLLQNGLYFPDWKPNQNLNNPSMAFSLKGYKSATSSMAYNIYRDGAKIASNVTTRYFTDALFEPSVGHTWEVTVACEENDSEPMSVIKEACNPVGIDENVKTTFSIVPNPAKSNILITAVHNFHTVEVISFLGQTVIAQSNVGNKLSLDVSDLTNGVYFVRIISKNGTSVQKFVKQ